MRLTDAIDIQSRAEVKSATGGITETWTTDCTVRARFEPTGGSEMWVYSRSYPTAAGVFKLFYDPNNVLTTAKRIVWEGRNYDIVYVRDSGKRSVRSFIYAVVENNAS